MRIPAFINTTRSKVAATFLVTFALGIAIIWSVHYDAMHTIAETRASGLSRLEAKGDVYGLYKYSRSLREEPPATHAEYALARFAPEGEASTNDRIIIMKSEAVYLVKDPDQSLEETRQLVQKLGGYVSTLQRNQNSREGALLELRIPAERFDDARAGLSRLAIKRQTEYLSTEDVTKQYVDTESQIRNLKAQELQYLQIMKGTGKIVDVLAVTEKLEEVRGKIEQLQGENNYRRHQAQLATLKVAFVTEVPIEIAGISWKPLLNAQLAWQDTKRSLIHWADSAVAVLLYLPVLMVWFVSIVAFLLGSWKALLLLKRVIDRFFPQTEPPQVQVGD